MKKTAGKKMLGPTLQLFESEPITDPVELARIDRRRKAAEKAMAVAQRKIENAMAAAERKAAKRKSTKRK